MYMKKDRTMERFVDYYNANIRDFKFTIKVANNNCQDGCFDVLKKYLEKYNLVSFSDAKKTPIQKTPLDFINIPNTEVYIMDVVIHYPISSDALLREVANILGLSEKNVVVYSEKDPRHTYTQEWTERMVDKVPSKPVLDGVEQWEKEPEYGEEYTSSFLKTLSDVAKERKIKTVTNSLSPPQASSSEQVPTKDEMEVNTDAVLNDRFRNKTDRPKKGANTLMSK